MTIVEMLRSEPVFAENEKYLFRNIKEMDKKAMLKLRREVSTNPQLYDLEGFEDLSWEDMMTSETEVVLALIDKKDQCIIGASVLKNADSDEIETGLDIAPEHQGKGIGTEVFSLLTSEISRRFPGKRIIARIYSNNLSSKQVIKKVGGVKIREELSEYDAFMAIMQEISEELGSDMPGDSELLGQSHIDVYEITSSPPK